MTRALVILILCLGALRCPAPVTLPPVGFDTANWSSIATALNDQWAIVPTLGNDHGGWDYIGLAGNGFACTAIASNQFATAEHVRPTYVTFKGTGYNVTDYRNFNEFAVITVSGYLPTWTRLNTNSLTLPADTIVWGQGNGYKPSQATYTSGPYTVFPIQNETRALRWGRIRISNVYTGNGFNEWRSYTDQSDTNANAAIVGNDSGGGIFIYNATTQKHELVGTHHGASNTAGNPDTGNVNVHTSAYYNRDAITAYLNAGDPPTNAVAAVLNNFTFQTLRIGP